jgi:hypothetical protein
MSGLRSPEHIAVIGMGCRFPGSASSPDRYWALLRDGRDAIVDIPEDRWDVRRYYDPDPEKPGKSYVRRGGFLQESIYDFDAHFFGISSREAAILDPQQRVLLEVTWDSFQQREERPVARDERIPVRGERAHRLGTGRTDSYHSGKLLDTGSDVVSLTVPGSFPAVNLALC